MNSSRNASRTGGLEEVIPSDVLRELRNPLRRRWLLSQQRETRPSRTRGHDEKGDAA